MGDDEDSRCWQQAPIRSLSTGGEISDTDRYCLIEDEYTWAARRSLACGLHVLIAVGGADRSLAVFNVLRSCLPEIVAASGNSPDTPAGRRLRLPLEGHRQLVDAQGVTASCRRLRPAPR